MDLRPYQIEAVQAVMNDLKHHKKLSLIAPTGSGKSAILVEIADRYLQENRSHMVMILSHLSALTIQTYRVCRELKPYIYTGILQADSFPSMQSKIVISTMQSARIEHKIKRFKQTCKEHVGLLIVDEAHFIPTT